MKSLKKVLVLSLGLTFFILINIPFCYSQTTDLPKTEIPFNWTYHISKANIDEDKVPQYKLPDVLMTQDGEVVTDSLIWIQKRRPEILELFRKEIYGRAPERRGDIKFVVNKIVPDALSGRATIKEV